LFDVIITLDDQNILYISYRWCVCCVILILHYITILIWYAFYIDTSDILFL